MDYSEHTIALQQLRLIYSEQMRSGKYAEAMETADAMRSHAAALWGCAFRAKTGRVDPIPRRVGVLAVDSEVG